LNYTQSLAISDLDGLEDEIWDLRVDVEMNYFWGCHDVVKAFCIGKGMDLGAEGRWVELCSQKVVFKS